MNENLSITERELVKRTLITAAIASAEQHGFASSQELWQAIFKAFFASNRVYPYPSCPYRIADDTLKAEYRQWVVAFLANVGQDIAFLEKYQDYLEDKQSARFLEIADSLIGYRKILRGTLTTQLVEECKLIGKTHLQLGNYEQAVGHFSSVLHEHLLGWELSSTIPPILVHGTLDVINLLISAHEQERDTNKHWQSSSRYNQQAGFQAMDVLLSLSFARAYRPAACIPDEELLQITSSLAKFRLLQGDRIKATECLRLTCILTTKVGNEQVIVGRDIYDHCHFQEPELLPKLWYMLGTLEQGSGKTTESIEAFKMCATLTNKYLTILNTRFEFKRQKDQLLSFLQDGTAEGIIGLDLRDFQKYKKLQEVETEAAERLKTLDARPPDN